MELKIIVEYLLHVIIIINYVLMLGKQLVYV
jgi:hypothetical protein